jgi:hypothetical protein
VARSVAPLPVRVQAAPATRIRLCLGLIYATSLIVLKGNIGHHQVTHYWLQTSSAVSELLSQEEVVRKPI